MSVPEIREHFEAADVSKVYETLGLSQAEFSDLIRCSASTVNRWKQGKSQVDTYGAIVLGMLWWLCVEQVGARPRCDRSRVVGALMEYRSPARVVVALAGLVMEHSR